MAKDKAAKKNPLEPTVFHEAWWLDLATDGACRFIDVREGGNVVGRFPFILRRKAGFPCLIMPTMTHFLGPAFNEGPGNEGTRLLRRQDIARALIDQLPFCATFEAKCHRGIGDVLAFQERGFCTGVQFTFEIAPQPERDVWKGMRDKRRGAIRRGLDAFKIEPIQDSESFIRFYEENLEERALVNYMNRAVWKRVLDGATQKGRGRMLGAWDRSGKLQATTFCVSDDLSSYFLLVSRRKNSDNGAVSCLAWQEIKTAMEAGLIFDFDGVLNEGMVDFFAGFGGMVCPRYVVRKRCLPFQIACDVKRALWHERRFF